MSDGYRFIGGTLCNEDGEPYQHKVVNESHYCVNCAKDFLWHRSERPEKCPNCSSIAVWPLDRPDAAHQRRFNELCEYLLKECVKDRPLTDAEIMSAWKQTKRYTLTQLIDQADFDRKAKRENGE